MKTRTMILGAMALCGVACGAPADPTKECAARPTYTSATANDNLEHRAYIVSRDSGELTVIDLDRLEILSVIETCGTEDHMLELSPDYKTAYLNSAGTNETIIIDVEKFQVQKRLPIARFPTHLSLSKDGKLVAVVAEADNAIAFIDTRTNEKVKQLDGFYTPHFVRFAPDRKYAYVANLGAHHVSRVDLDTLTIDGEIVLDGFQGSPTPTPAPDEGGFADVQIDADGILYGAHAGTGRVLVYDTRAQKKLAELAVGARPWIVYAEHPFADLRAHVVPNFGDETVSVIDGVTRAVRGAIGGADRESFGVNYSPLAPGLAFVMNRFREDIAVVDIESRKPVATIPVGGNTETASTTADGKWIVATVSSANRVVVIDAKTNEIVKTFENVGRYPWSVTIPLGQNYCH